MKSFLISLFACFSFLAFKSVDDNIVEVKKHLPLTLYRFLKGNHLLLSFCRDNYGPIPGKKSCRIYLDEIEGSKVVMIECHNLGLKDEDSSEVLEGFQIGFEKGHLKGGAFFDEDGRDFVFDDSYNEEEEKEFIEGLIDDILVLFKKKDACITD